jgi:hypothetical protein
MDIPEVARQAGNHNFYTPNSGFVAVDMSSGSSADLGEAANSKRLWLNSLVSAHACLECGIQNPAESQNHFVTAAGIVKSYLEGYDSDQGVFQDAWRDEHAVANRLFVLTAFIHYAARRDVFEPEREIAIIGEIIPIESLFLHAVVHAEWLHSDHHYVKNNHGVMMDLALAQFSVVAKETDKTLADKYRMKCVSRLEMMLELTFDKDGCCTENSSTYHFVNYGLFSKARDFLLEYKLIEAAAKWEDTLGKARHVGDLFLRSNKTLPLVGDSETMLATFFPSMESDDGGYGLGYYPDAGFFVVSQPDFHMTLRAGGMAYSHRHIDDLSLTIQYQGKDFIIDCGMYNYDIQDKLRRWFISTRAHSGIYVESMGNVRFANFPTPKDMSRFISLEGHGGRFAIRAAHNLSAEVEVERLVSYGDKSFMIEDSFCSAHSQSWRMQLNLHPDVIVHSLDAKGGFRLENGSASLCIWFDPRFDVQIENISYSPTFMCLEKSKALVMKGDGDSLMARTKIDFGATQLMGASSPQ